MQLVAYGAQDIYLTGNPQITFFKVVYRRHTNFSMESIEQTFNGNATFGSRVSCTVSRNGDLMHRVYVEAQICKNADTDWEEINLGHALIEYVEVEIGGQRMDKHYGEWLEIWNELTQKPGHKFGYETFVGKAASADEVVTVYVPLQFWFCRNPGLALPLIALQYHEVKFYIKLADYNNLVSVTDSDSGDSTCPPANAPVIQSLKLWVDYIYLDTDERRRFAQVSHEYLIEQLQFTGSESLSNAGSTVQAKLSFNHPCKELIWVVNQSSNEFGDFSDCGANPVDKAVLKLNGHDRFAEREGAYFDLVQPYQHHTNVPYHFGVKYDEITQSDTGADAVTCVTDSFVKCKRGINVYSFALKPEEHQPSGTCNMSRIDNAVLLVTPKSGLTGDSSSTNNLNIYATNYNVLRIMSGMGGLAYSN
jgi:hypothetical protein